MTKPTHIAIDGPAASGKSTVGNKLAKLLGYLYFDTGVMYRAVTLAGLEKGLDIEDEVEITRLSERMDIAVHPPSADDGRDCDIWIDGIDQTNRLRFPEVNANVSVVSQYAGVRKILSSKQRQIGLKGNIVMVGRDIGTVVLPEADLKIFLDASSEERARRRLKDSEARGENFCLLDILEGIKARDRIDSTRDVAPLRPAEDAVLIDSDEIPADDVVARIIEIIESRSKTA